MKRILYLALFVLLISACAAQPCKVQSRAYLEADIELLGRFQDTLSLAGSSGPFNLSPIVADMQALKREHSALKHPACADEIHARTQEGMGLSIEAALAFMAGKSDEMEAKMSQAGDAIRQATALMESME